MQKAPAEATSHPEIEDVIFNAPVGTEFNCTDKCHGGHAVRVPLFNDDGSLLATSSSFGFCGFTIVESGRVNGDGDRVVIIATSAEQTLKGVKVSDLAGNFGNWKINERKGLPLSRRRAEELCDLAKPVEIRRGDTFNEIRRLMMEACAIKLDPARAE